MQFLNDGSRRLLTNRMLRIGWLCVVLLIGGQAVAAAHLHGDDAEALCAVCSVGNGDDGIATARVGVALPEQAAAAVGRPVVDIIAATAPIAANHPRAPPHS